MSVYEFDQLYRRIEKFAEPLATGIPESPVDKSTKVTKELGGLAFVLFDSRSMSDEAKGKRLYSRSIACITDKPAMFTRIKRRELLPKPRNSAEPNIVGESAANLGKIANYFERYELYID